MIDDQTFKDKCRGCGTGKPLGDYAKEVLLGLRRSGGAQDWFAFDVDAATAQRLAQDGLIDRREITTIKITGKGLSAIAGLSCGLCEHKNHDNTDRCRCAQLGRQSAQPPDQTFTDFAKGQTNA